MGRDPPDAPPSLDLTDSDWTLRAPREYVTFEVTGAELLQIAGPSEYGEPWWELWPQVDSTRVDPAATYRFSTFPNGIWCIGGAYHVNVRNARWVADDGRCRAIFGELLGVQPRNP